MARQNRNHGLRKLCTCSLKRWPICPHSWHLNFCWKGVNHRLSLDRHLGRHVPSKTEAEAAAEKIRAAIRDGEFRAHAPEVAVEPALATVETVAEIYLRRELDKRRNDVSRLKRLCDFRLESGRRLGDKALAAVTEDDLELCMDALRAEGLVASTRNKCVQLLRHMFRWAVRKGYLTRNPITEDSGLKRERHARRSRRLLGDEEQRLVAAAPLRMQWLIVAAIESGARLGELLGLQWRDVDLERGEITIRAENAKDGENRHVPISTRLRAVLGMVPRHDPAGDPFGPRHHVFGNEIGERRRPDSKAWQATVLKANGHAPRWTRTKGLAAESQAVYRRVRTAEQK